MIVGSSLEILYVPMIHTNTIKLIEANVNTTIVRLGTLKRGCSLLNHVGMILYLAMEYVTREAPMTPVFVDINSIKTPSKPTHKGSKVIKGFAALSPMPIPFATPVTGSF